MNISQWKNGDRTFFSLEVDDRLLLFEAVVTVNLTSLLVLTTLFISVSKSLPPTAYVKMIDIWLIFCQLIPFAEVFNVGS